MQLQDMYQEIILDHYRNPHHKGLREPFDAQVYHVNPTCGDEVTLRVALKPGVGRDVVELHCGTCHSLDYLTMNESFLNRKGWEAEVNKMVGVFGVQIRQTDTKDHSRLSRHELWQWQLSVTFVL